MQSEAATSFENLYSYDSVPYVITQWTAVFINTDVKTSGFWVYYGHRRGAPEKLTWGEVSALHWTSCRVCVDGYG